MIDENVGFVPIGKLTIIEKDNDKSRFWEGKMFLNDDLGKVDINKGDLWLNTNSSDFPNDQKMATFEEVEKFLKIRGRLPVFSDWTQIQSYESWAKNKEDNGYVDLRKAKKEYSPSRLRIFYLNCIQETEKRFDNIGNYRTEALVHEQGHIDLEDETPGLRELTQSTFEILNKVSDLYRGNDQASTNLVIQANNLYYSLLRIMNIHEAVAISTELNRAEIDVDHLRYAESYRITELLSNWISGDFSAGIFMQNEYKIDSHNIATIALMFGSEVVDSNCESLINFEKVARLSSVSKRFEAKEIPLESAVLIAFMEKAEEMMAGKNIFVDKREREKIINQLKPLLPSEIAQTNATLRRFAENVKEIGVLNNIATRTLTITDQIDLLNGLSGDK